MKALGMSVPKRRQLRQPSGRNLQVYRDVRELGETQAAVALRHGVTQERVSQICRQVERWLARCAQPTGDDGGPLADLILARKRYQQMFALAARELAKGDVELVTERVRQLGDERQVARTTRTEPLNPQWGKIVVVLTDRLRRLDAKLGPDEEWEFATFSPPQANVELNSSTTSSRAGFAEVNPRGGFSDQCDQNASEARSCEARQGPTRAVSAEK
jgi:hypothetical protein